MESNQVGGVNELENLKSLFSQFFSLLNETIQDDKNEISPGQKDAMDAIHATKNISSLESVSHNSMHDSNVNSTADVLVSAALEISSGRDSSWNNDNIDDNVGSQVAKLAKYASYCESVSHNSMPSTYFHLNVNSTTDVQVSAALETSSGRDSSWNNDSINDNIGSQVAEYASHWDSVSHNSMPLTYLDMNVNSTADVGVYATSENGSRRDRVSDKDRLGDNVGSESGTEFRKNASSPEILDTMASIESVVSGSHNSMHMEMPNALVVDEMICSTPQNDDAVIMESVRHNSMQRNIDSIHQTHRDILDQQNLEQEENDDEDVFQSFVENSDDLLDVEFHSEVRNDLASVFETFDVRNLGNCKAMPQDAMSQDAMPQFVMPQDDPIPTESQNHLKLNITRLNGSCDNTKMFVRTSNQKSKRLCCPYCKKLLCKLSRHVEGQHKEEPAVKKLAGIAKKSKERRKIQDTIRKAGTLMWNTDPYLNNGELIVCRRPNPTLNKKATDYLICPNCVGIYTITNLRNHFADCTKGAFKGGRNIKVLSRAIEGRSSGEASDQLRGVIPVMREDSIVQLIRYDWVLIVYGNLLCMKYNAHYQQNMIRAKLRLAGRILQAMRNIEKEVTDFASIFYPKRYKSVMEAIKVVGKYNSATNEFVTPATAASACTSIKQIGSILKCEYIQKEDGDHVKKTDDFLYLMESQFTSIISKRVKESQMQRKRDKDHKVPSRDDVRLLSEYLNRERNTCFDELSKKFSKANWVKLSELTIASVIVFNRRRTGEVQNISLVNFSKRQSINETTNEELFEALSDESKKIAKRFCRFQIRGKRGVLNVNVLLKADLTSCIELLLKHRTEVGISPENPFLFALPSLPGDNRIKIVNACTVLTKFSTKCGAKDSTTLRGTNLRKHFATKCMAMELSDDMVSEVAKFMGHAESVHREHYRHNTIDREIVKIAKLLEAAQGLDEPDSDVDDNEVSVTVPKSGGGRKLKSVSDEGDHPKKKRCTSSVTSTKSTLKAGGKRKATSKKENPKKIKAASARNAKPALQAGGKQNKKKSKGTTKK